MEWGLHYDKMFQVAKPLRRRDLARPVARKMEANGGLTVWELDHEDFFALCEDAVNTTSKISALFQVGPFRREGCRNELGLSLDDTTSGLAQVDVVGEKRWQGIWESAMDIVENVALASAQEIHAGFERWLSGCEISEIDLQIARDVSKPLIDMWCWLRDDGQVYARRYALKDLSVLSGRFRGLNYLRRTDIPAPMRSDLKSALEKRLPSLDAKAGGPNEWDDRLHGMYFVPFVDSLGEVGKE